MSFSLPDDLHCSLWTLLCWFLPLPPAPQVDWSECTPKESFNFSPNEQRAECDFSNLASYQKEAYGSDNGSDSEDERRSPDVILDALASYRFQGKKRPEIFISSTLSLNSYSQMFSPAGPVATTLYELTTFFWIQMSILLIVIDKVTTRVVCKLSLLTHLIIIFVPYVISYFLIEMRCCYNALTLF